MSKKRLLILFGILSCLVVGYWLLASLELPLEDFRYFINQHTILGPAVFIIYVIFATVVAPFSALPLVPFASYVWSPVALAFYFFIAWNISAGIVFYISHHYGRDWVKKFVNLETVDRLIGKYVLNQPSTFWRLLLLRTIIPLDVANYAFGLTKIKISDYIIITLIRTAIGAVLWAWIPTQLIKIINPLPLAFIFIGLLIIAAFFLPSRKRT